MRLPPTNERRGQAEGSPPLSATPPADGARTVSSMDFSELGGPRGSGHPIVGGQFVEGGVIIPTGDPHGLAVTKAGSGGENHRSVSVELRVL